MSSAESASPQGRILAHTCGESKYFAGSRGVGAQLQLIYGFADYFAAASCVRLPSSLARTCTNKAHAAALCSASVRFKRGNTFWPQKAAAALTRLPPRLHLRTIWRTLCGGGRPRTLFAQPLTTRKFRLRDVLPGLIKNIEC